MKALNINEKHEAKNYPYGRLRTSMFYSVEYNDNRGFRVVTQSINPKTGELNNPHKSTYYDIVWMYTNPDNGHIEWNAMQIRGVEDINKVAKFLSEHKDAVGYSPQMLSTLAAKMLHCLKISVSISKMDLEEANPFLTPLIKNIISIFKKESTDFSLIHVDMEQYNKLKRK